MALSCDNFSDALRIAGNKLCINGDRDCGVGAGDTNRDCDDCDAGACDAVVIAVCKNNSNVNCRGAVVLKRKTAGCNRNNDNTITNGNKYLSSYFSGNMGGINTLSFFQSIHDNNGTTINNITNNNMNINSNTINRKKIAFLFSGQGQYWEGMGSELFAKNPVIGISSQIIPPLN